MFCGACGMVASSCKLLISEGVNSYEFDYIALGDPWRFLLRTALRATNPAWCPNGVRGRLAARSRRGHLAFLRLDFLNVTISAAPIVNPPRGEH